MFDGHLGGAGDIGDLLGGLLVVAELRCHVDRGGGHRDRRSAGHDVQFDRLASDVTGGALNGRGEAEIRAESRHEIAGRDQLHAGLQRLQDELEAAADLLLRDARNGADLLERSRYVLLSAGDVQAGGRDGIVRASLQRFTVVHLFEQPFRSI